MFKGNQSISFKTDKPKDKVYEIIQDNLKFLGNVDISDRGKININAPHYSGFFHKSEITGIIKEREGKYNVVLEWSVNRKWLIDSAYISRFMANNKIRKKVTAVLDNLHYEFK